MYLEETEARNDRAHEGQYQSKQPTDRLGWETEQSESEVTVRQSPLTGGVGGGEVTVGSVRSDD
jgi:hypothetical protein